MIDFTRAFRLWNELQAPADLVRGDAAVLERMAALTEETVHEVTHPFLSDAEVSALLARRDLLMEHFDRLVAQKGVQRVLY